MKKHYANILIFSLIIFTFMLWWIFRDKEEIIASERRRATPLPHFSEIITKEFSTDFDKAMSDTFPLRETMRHINTAFRLNALSLGDVNGYYKAEGHVMKLEPHLQTEQITAGADKINEICSKYLANSNVYYSVIPDKNHFLAAKNGYPHIESGELLDIFQNKVENAEYIDIFPLLSIDDYYKTDSHWSQDKILPVAEKIITSMGKKWQGDNFERKTAGNFRGVYGVQSAIKSAPDKMIYLTCNNMENTAVVSIENEGTTGVYNKDKFTGVDPYDFYLDGAAALLTLQRMSSDNSHLIIFRDSFGSSIAPLFLNNYSKITLVDLRYIASSQLDKYVSFENADVLFLYNTSIINNAFLLR